MPVQAFSLRTDRLRTILLRLTTFGWGHVLAWAVLCGMAVGGLQLQLEVAAHRAEVRETQRLAQDALKRAEADYDRVVALLMEVEPRAPLPCDEKWLADLNRLDFDMPEVKEFGGFSDDSHLACTSRLGVLPRPIVVQNYDSTYGRVRVQAATRPLISPTSTAYAVRVGRVNALLEQGRWLPVIEDDQFTLELVDRGSGRSIVRRGDISQADEAFTVESAHFRVRVSSSGAYAESWRAARSAWLWPALVFAVVCALLVLRQLVSRIRSTSNQLEHIIHFHPGSIGVVFQPIIAIETTQVVGAEALLRMKDPSGKAIPPNVVFNLLDNRHRLARKLTWRILARTFAEVGAWLREDRKRFIGVNLSQHDVATRELVPLIQQLLIEHRIEPRQLHLELLETAEFKSETTLRVLQDLRKIGCELWIDDFGVGYSNLARLHTLPINGVKLDREWVEALDDSQHIRTDAVAHLVLFAGSNGLGVVAEGVSDELAMRTLMRLGVQQMQGFLFSPGLPIDEFLRLSRAAITSDDPRSMHLAREGQTGHTS
jgi:sensor c-di-GMP phosphodiesterase-like protein